MQTATEMTQPQVRPTPPREAVQRVILPGVSWSTYEALLADMQDSHAVHFAYDQGMLEIMAPSYEHESVKGHLALLSECPGGRIRYRCDRGWLDYLSSRRSRKRF